MELHKYFNMEETELKETVDLVTFTEEILKGTLILIWNLVIYSCSYVLVHTSKVYEMFVYKHAETIECIKK